MQTTAVTTTEVTGLAGPEPLPTTWQEWLIEARLLGWRDLDLVEYLTQKGFEAPRAEAAIRELDADSVYRIADRVGQRLRKQESLLRVREELARTSTHALAVDRRAGLTLEAFREEYYAANRPVILTDIVGQWPAKSVWSPKLLRDVYGEETVEIMDGRNADPQYEINGERHKTSVRMADYVNAVLAVESTNDFYLVANNHFLDSPAGGRLWADLQPLPAFLNAHRAPGQAFLWFGPAGTVTPFHHDTMNVLLAQIRGRKRVILVSPDQLPWMYNEVSVYSRVDAERPNIDEYPLYGLTRRIEVVLEPGEALFLPVGWWHAVRALDLSLSVSFTNFVFPNSFHWANPNIHR